MAKIPHIVCLGGGNAMPKALLEGLKKHPIKISVISAMLDSGGFAGKERELFKTKVAFGDIRRAALALSEAPEEKKEFLSRRLENGIVLANSYVTGAAFSAGLEELSDEIKEDLKIPENRQVLPVTLDEAVLCARLESGEIIRGETNIDVPKHDASLKIKSVFLEPEARAFKPALAAIKNADLITLGPGDLYSSLAQILLVKGVAEAIKKSLARKVFICNLMTKSGETHGFSVLDFAFESEKYLGQEFDSVIFNNRPFAQERLAAYKNGHPELLEQVKFSENLDEDKFIGKDLVQREGPIVHDADKVAEIILNLCPRYRLLF